MAAPHPNLPGSRPVARPGYGWRQPDEGLTSQLASPMCLKFLLCLESRIHAAPKPRSILPSGKIH